MGILETLFNRLANWFFNLKTPALSPEQKEKVKIVAHRGLHEGRMTKENSIEAFHLAETNKIWGIEFDVRFTADHVPVVHHDSHLGKTISRSDLFIEKMDSRQLKRMAPSIPTLENVIESFGKKLHLMIEVKEIITNPAHEKTLIKLLTNLVGGQDYHLLALSPEILECLPSFPAKIKVDVAWLHVKDHLDQALKHNHGGLAGHFVLTNSKILKECKAKNISVGTGFIESKGCLYREINRGVDWFFTDRPLSLLQHLK